MEWTYFITCVRDKLIEITQFLYFQISKLFQRINLFEKCTILRYYPLIIYNIKLLISGVMWRTGKQFKKRLVRQKLYQLLRSTSFSIDVKKRKINQQCKKFLN